MNYSVQHEQNGHYWFSSSCYGLQSAEYFVVNLVKDEISTLIQPKRSSESLLEDTLQVSLIRLGLLVVTP